MTTSRSPLIPIFLIVFVDTLGVTLILPLMPFYAQQFGARPAVVGLVFATYSFCQLFASPIFGRLSDRVGRRRLLLASQAGSLLGYALLAYGPSLPWVFASRVIDGLTAGNVSLAYACASDVTLPADRSRAFGLISAALSLGFLCGPALGATLAPFGLQYPALGAIVFAALSMLATALLLPDKPPAPEPPAPGPTDTTPAPAPPAPAGPWALLEPLRRPFLRPLFSAYGIFCLASALYLTGLAVYATARLGAIGITIGPSEIGYLFAYGGIISIILQGQWFGALAKRFGEDTLIRVGFALFGLGFITLAAATNLPLLILAHTLAVSAIGLLRPALLSLFSQKAAAAEQGTVLGLSQAVNSVSQIIAPLLAGWLLDQHALLAYALGAATLTAFGLLSALRTPQQVHEVT